MLKRISKALLGIMLCCAAANVSAGPRAVFMGDSIFKGWSESVGMFFSENDFLNKGVSGNTTADMLLRYDGDVVSSGAKAVVIMAGINDIAQNDGSLRPVDDIAMNIATMAKKSADAGQKVILCSILPSSNVWGITENPQNYVSRLNDMIQEIVLENNYAFCDFYGAFVMSDGSLDYDLLRESEVSGAMNGGTNVHPSYKGYLVMAEALLPIINEVVPATK